VRFSFVPVAQSIDQFAIDRPLLLEEQICKMSPIPSAPRVLIPAAIQIRMLNIVIP